MSSKHLWLLPFVLFAANEILQISLVKSRGMSTWVGGGYGMFANIDKPEARLLEFQVKQGESWITQKNPDKKLKKYLHQFRLNMDENYIREFLPADSRVQVYVPEAREQLKLHLVKTVYAD